MGDLNADHLKDGNDAKLIRKLAPELSLQTAQHGATHHTRTSHTWIDQILVDENDTILEAHNIPANFRSRHNIIDICLQWGDQPLHVTETKYRNYINGFLPPKSLVFYRLVTGRRVLTVLTTLRLLSPASAIISLRQLNSLPR